MTEPNKSGFIEGSLTDMRERFESAITSLIADSQVIELPDEYRQPNVSVIAFENTNGELLAALLELPENEPFFRNKTNLNQYSKSSNQYSKSSNQYSKSSKQYSEGSKQYSESSKQYSESSKQYSESSKQYSESSKQYSESSKQYSSLVLQGISVVHGSFCGGKRPEMAILQEMDIPYSKAMGTVRFEFPADITERQIGEIVEKTKQAVSLARSFNQ